MNFTLIVCTYMRPIPLLNLLNSVKEQILYPNEILIIDGSTNRDTENMLSQNEFQNLKYFLVSKQDRGLTRQRNFGVSKVQKNAKIICFLDDDTVLDSNYFKEIIGDNLRFSFDYYTFDDIRIEHGHQRESIHAVDMNNLILPGGEEKRKEPILNFPFGSS